MAHLPPKYSTVWRYGNAKVFCIGLSGSKMSWKNKSHHISLGRRKLGFNKKRGYVPQCCRSSTEEVGLGGKNEVDGIYGMIKGQFGYLLNEYGWQVRRMVEKEDEMRKVAHVQAEAFHEPVIFFNDVFFQFFEAEVLSGLLYRLRNSPPDRYACLVAESTSNGSEPQQKEVVGVVDVTVLRDEDILQHLPGVDEYLYVSGIAVLNNFRRQRVATTLLKGCEMLSALWGFKYLVLRAYEDDLGSRKLYKKAGYRVVSGDPPWMTTWIGRKRRVLMIKMV